MNSSSMLYRKATHLSDKPDYLSESQPKQDTWRRKRPRGPATGQSSRDYQSAMSAKMTEKASMKQPMTKRELLQLNHISIEHMKSRVGEKMSSGHFYGSMAQKRA